MKIEVNGNKPRFVPDNKSLTSRSLRPQRRFHGETCIELSHVPLPQEPVRFFPTLIPASGNS
ncbi:MAG: hypothetical protein QOH67_5116 [Hyphomicrobiales bacterium]|nr:hypothetical protein [Hyphomicrobiales bacterium]